ncbi:hypothetical protein C8J57DRAFT_1446322 [Mycena rebaudengoi]|nr:hypothetical protein C8J57DRAFT_1446322 [Mycena rebaudengoi]
MSFLFWFSSVLAIAAAGFQFWLRPVLLTLGVWRTVIPFGPSDCSLVPLAACEKIVLHAPSGVLYAACSTPASRTLWTPTLYELNATGVSQDYIATYAPNGAIARLQPSFPGLSLHGMDVVPSAANPSELFIFAVNHRKPADVHAAATIGADSTVEIFKTVLGTTQLTHLRTVRDPVIITPNDIVGSADGKSFYFTNDHGAKTGLVRKLGLGYPAGSVGYCDVDEGCKFAINNMHGANGITRAPNNDTFFVASSVLGGITVLERQDDNALVKIHTIPTDRGVDNLSVDSEGVVWGAGFPQVFATLAHIRNPSLLAPSSAHAISQNLGPSSFFGEKYTVTKVFEDDGKLASGSTTVVHDPERRRLFLTGPASPHLTVCKL